MIFLKSNAQNGSFVVNNHIWVKSSLIATMSLIAVNAFAVENGGIITPPGIYDFGAGKMPPPSEYGAIATRIVTTNATTLKDNNGDDAAVKPDLNVNAVVIAALKMTDYDFLGGKYGFAFVVPILDSNLDLSIPTPVGTHELTGSKRGIGDIQVSPVIVQWKPSPNLWLKSELMIQLPTGDYDSHRTISPGTNHWTFQPSLNMTYIYKGFEVSTSTQVNFNTKNDATDYKSGTELQQDFALGKHIGHWTFGLGGYVYKQLTDDKAPGITDGHRSEVMALGPAVGYFNHKSVIPTVYFHAYKEFDAKNRAEGSQIALRLAKTF